MEILLWWIIPLLVCSLTLWSWIIRGSLPGGFVPSAIYFRMKQVVISTAGFWGLHGMISILLNTWNRPSEIKLGKATVRALHWAVYPSRPLKHIAMPESG